MTFRKKIRWSSLAGAHAEQLRVVLEYGLLAGGGARRSGAGERRREDEDDRGYAAESANPFCAQSSCGPLAPGSAGPCRSQP